MVAVAALAGSSAQQGFPGKNGRIVFNDQSGSLVLANADGTGLGAVGQYPGGRSVDRGIISPSGKLIAYSKGGASDPDIFVIGVDGSGQREITFSRGMDVDPTWSGDGSKIAFETTRNGDFDIYSVSATGSSPARLTSGSEDEQDPAWSPNSARIVYTIDDGTTKQIWVMNADGTGKTQLTKAANLSENPNWSPNGQRIVFDSDRAEAGQPRHLLHEGRRERRPAADRPAPRSTPCPHTRPTTRRLVFVQRPRAEGLAQALRDERERRRGNETHLDASGFAYQMVPDWQPVAGDPTTPARSGHDQRRPPPRHAEGRPICGLGGNDLIEGFGGNDTSSGRG